MDESTNKGPNGPKQKWTGEGYTNQNTEGVTPPVYPPTRTPSTQAGRNRVEKER